MKSMKIRSKQMVLRLRVCLCVCVCVCLGVMARSGWHRPSSNQKVGSSALCWSPVMWAPSSEQRVAQARHRVRGGQLQNRELRQEISNRKTSMFVCVCVRLCVCACVSVCVRVYMPVCV